MSKKAKGKEITVKFWKVVVSGGDGSAYAMIFKTEKEAEKYLEESGGDRFSDDRPVEVTLKVDQDGNLLQPPLSEIKDGILHDAFCIPKKSSKPTCEPITPDKKEKDYHFYRDQRDWTWR